MRFRKEMRVYQDGGIVPFIKRVKRCALFVDPGLGKTVATATAFCDLIDDLECGMTLIVAPPRVAKKTWPDEFKEWAHLKGKSYVFISGSIKRRRKLMKRRACFHIISVDLLPWILNELGGHAPNTRRVKALLTGPKPVEGATEAQMLQARKDDLVKHGIAADRHEWLESNEVERLAAKEAKLENTWLAPKKMPYDAIVLDESTKLKSHNSNRFRAMRLMAFHVKYFVILTGTPSPNGYEDLWSQIYLLDGGQRLGRTITDFRDRWCRENHTGHGYTVKDYALKIVEDRLADIAFTLREEDYAELPPKIYQTIKLQFDEITKKRYDKFKTKYVLEALSGKMIKALSGASITNKLLQLANGIVYDENKEEHAFHSIKLDALQDLIEENGGKPVLVAYHFKSDLKRILAKFPQAKIFKDDGDTQDAWNRGEIPILLVHPQSAAHGLNLQFGGNLVVWYGPTWSLELYIQLNKRLHRSGQINPVVIYHLIMEGTMDEDAMEALEWKDTNQEALLNALKKHVEPYYLKMAA